MSVLAKGIKDVATISGLPTSNSRGMFSHIVMIVSKVQEFSTHTLYRNARELECNMLS